MLVVQGGRDEVIGGAEIQELIGPRKLILKIGGK
jgi:hypothetical protein